MDKFVKELMLEAGYAAPEIAQRGQKLVELTKKAIFESIANTWYSQGIDFHGVSLHRFLEELDNRTKHS